VVKKEKGKGTKRISVALDDKTNEILNNLSEKKGMTVSDIVRIALVTYSELENDDTEIDIEKYRKYLHLLYGGESVIIDIELWACLLDELNELGSEKAWNCIRQIAEIYGIHFKSEGFEDTKSILKYLETNNWYTLKANGDKDYTLVLRTRNSSEIVKVFLENIFRVQGIQVEIVNGLRKIVITEKS